MKQKVAVLLGITKTKVEVLDKGLDTVAIKAKYKKLVSKGKSKYQQLVYLDNVRGRRNTSFVKQPAPKRIVSEASLKAYAKALELTPDQVKKLVSNKKNPMPLGTVDEVVEWYEGFVVEAEEQQPAEPQPEAEQQSEPADEARDDDAALDEHFSESIPDSNPDSDSVDSAESE